MRRGNPRCRLSCSPTAFDSDDPGTGQFDHDNRKHGPGASARLDAHIDCPSGARGRRDSNSFSQIATVNEDDACHATDDDATAHD
jgi:hypothetical protein